MAYKTILVHVDHSKRCQARIELAVDMAIAHEAHLIGLYLTFSPFPYPRHMYEGLPDLAQRLERSRKLEEEATQQMFRAIAASNHVTAEWRAPDGYANEIMPAQARCADLVIMGQQAEDDREAFVAEDFIERTVLDSGRPVLLVPYAGPVPRHFDNILFAWNGSREAARAGADALGLLKRATHVTVMSIDPKNAQAQQNELPGADIALYFARHGVKVEIASSSGDGDVKAGELLLSRAADKGANLIVMGGYGHSRLQELVMGGVSRTLLHSMTVPVLMSH